MTEEDRGQRRRTLCGSASCLTPGGHKVGGRDTHHLPSVSRALRDRFFNHGHGLWLRKLRDRPNVDETEEPARLGTFLLVLVW